MTAIRATVGAMVKSLREAHGLSQPQLAEAVDASTTTIVSIEKGHTATNIDMIETLAEQLGVRPYELLGASSPAPSSGDPRAQAISEAWPRLTAAQREALWIMFEEFAAMAEESAVGAAKNRKGSGERAQ